MCQIKGVLAHWRGPNEGVAAAETIERLQISTAHVLDQVKPVLVPTVVIGVEHRRCADVETFVAEQAQVVDVHFVLGRVSLVRVAKVPQVTLDLQSEIRPTDFDVLVFQLLVLWIGIEQRASVCPVNEILAGPNPMCPTV